MPVPLDDTFFIDGDPFEAQFIGVGRPQKLNAE